MPKRLHIFLLLLACMTWHILPAQRDSMPVKEQEKKTKKRCHKRVGYFASLKPERLVRKLTKGLQSDSEKVAAIHCWITSHIRYDMKKFQSYDFAVKSNRNILRRRKAVCYGYATLFNELCSLAGIQTVIVTGYTKNQDVDICDSFYLEDHAWNAVYLNNRWYLSDLTWDAGHVSHWKRSFYDRLLFIVTLGRVRRITYKSHFERFPQWKYFLKPGDYFYYDHMPANRIWQLTEDIKSINDFKTDSSYYFLGPRDSSDTYSDDLDGQRQAYFTNPDTINEINDGYAFQGYNFRNHYQVIISNHLKAEPFSAEIDFKSKDSLYQAALADSVITYCSKSMVDADSNAYYLDEQLQMLIGHVRFKNQLLKRQNKQLTKTCKTTSRYAQKGLRTDGRMRAYIRKNRTGNRNSLKKIVKDQKIYAVKPSRRVKQADSMRLAEKITRLDSQINAVKLQQLEMMQTGDSALSSLFPRLSTCADFQKEKQLDIAGAVYLRQYGGFDDLDYLVRKVKDSLMQHDQQHDSDLFSGDMLLYDSLYKTCKHIQDQYKVILRLYRLKLAATRQLKSKCDETQAAAILVQYKSELKLMEEELAFYESWQQDFITLLDSSRSVNLEIRRNAVNTARWIEFENQFRIREAGFRKHKKALSTLNRIRKQEAAKQLRRAKKAKRKFTQKKA